MFINFKMEYVYREEVPQEFENQGGVKFVRCKGGSNMYDLRRGSNMSDLRGVQMGLRTISIFKHKITQIYGLVIISVKGPRIIHV